MTKKAAPAGESFHKEKDTEDTNIEKDRGKIEKDSRKTRLACVDLARAMAVFMIVTAHVLRKGTLADYLMSTGVACFIFLSGIVWHWRKDKKALFKDRMRRLYLPYLGTAIFSIFIYSYAGSLAGDILKTDSKETETGILRNLGYMLYANSKNHHSMKWNETLWFIPCFLVTLLLAEITETLVRRAEGRWKARGAGKSLTEEKKSGRTKSLKRNLFRFLVTALFVAAGAVLSDVFDIRLPWQGESACHMLLFYELGIAAGEEEGVRRILALLERQKKEKREKTGEDKNKEERVKAARQGKESPVALEKAGPWKEKIKILTAAVLFLAAGALLTAYASPDKNISIRTDEYPLGVLSYVTLFCSVSGYFLLSTLLPKAEPVLFVGRRSLDIMLFNKFPVVAVQLVAKKMGFSIFFMEKSSVPAFFTGGVLALVCIFLCLVFTGILHKGAAWMRKKRWKAGQQNRR